MLKTWPSSIFEKKFLSGQKYRKYAARADFHRKTVFLEFLELYFIYFHEILHTDANDNT